MSTTYQYQVIYWRDVPTQIRLKAGRKRNSAELPQRFQKTMYRAAYRGKSISGDAYSDSFRPSVWQPVADDLVIGRNLPEITAALIQQIENDYDEQRLNQLALNAGFQEEKSQNG